MRSWIAIRLVGWAGAGCCLCFGAGLCWAGAADDALLPLSLAAQKVTAPGGFRVTLFAGEPDVRQPIALAFDDRGRLWVAECDTYADLQTNFDLRLRDRIVLLEDEDHDGRMDRRKVFWDRGQRLTSVVPGFGGVWALCAPHLIFIPDRDGDDIPDADPELLLDGWNDGLVRHNIVNGLKWGPDGWLYGRHGIQATSVVGPPGSPADQRTRLNCGLWRYHPTRRVFEVVCQGGTNPWGHDWDDYGELFFINTVIGHLWHGIPGAYYKRMYGEHLAPRRYQLIDQHADHYHWDTGKSWTDSRNAAGGADALGGGHAHSGLMIYLGTNWPAPYRNGLFTLNFHGRRINQERLERFGSGYVARHEPDLVQFPDPWFRGIDLASGPNGAVFVLDWSDTGECHENDSDGVHRETGRVYHISYGPPAPPPIADVAKLSDAELVALQLHPNDWYVRHARRLLQERAAAGRDMTAVQTALRELFRQQKDGPRLLRLLWALHVSGGTGEPWLVGLLGHDQENVRAWAVRLLVEAGPPGEPVLARLQTLASEDPSALVRLHLASALQRLRPEQRLDLALALAAHAEDAQDHNLPLMIWYGMEACFQADPARARRLAEASRIPLLRQFTVRRLAEQLDKEPTHIDSLLRWASAQESTQLHLDVVRGLTDALRGWRKATPPPAWESFRTRATQSDNPEIGDRLRSLSVVFGDGRAREEVQAIALDPQADGEARRAALSQLIETRPPNLFNLLVKLAEDQATLGVAIRGLALFDRAQVPPLVVKRFDQMTPDDQAAAVGMLASRPGYALALLEAVAQNQIPRRLVTSYHARQIQSHGQDTLNAQLATVWGELRNSDTEQRTLITRYKTLLRPERLAQADLKEGRRLFKEICASCHRLYGEGGIIGPDLTGSGRGNLDYLLENLVAPSALVPADYRVSTLDLKDDRVVSGVVVQRTDQTVTVQTPTEQLVLERAEILDIQESTLSLMPEGLLQSLTENQIRDLTGYLMSTDTQSAH